NSHWRTQILYRLAAVLFCLLFSSLVRPAEAYDAGDALALLLGTILTVVGLCAFLGWYARRRDVRFSFKDACTAYCTYSTMLEVITVVFPDVVCVPSVCSRAFNHLFEAQCHRSGVSSAVLRCSNMSL
uniref:Uncharacterized protein n=1 Tax=Stegastes partitus TaxID=144197 RepID=A0A3B4Z648_9TELE